jgi:hypothetical protein
VLAPVALRVRGASFGFGGGAIYGLLPDVVAGVYGFGQLDLDYRGLLAPSVRLSVTRPGDQDVGAAVGSARFNVVVPRIEICPLRFGSVHANIRPCVSGSVAIIESVGVNALAAGTEVRPVWIPGLSALVSVRIVGPLQAFGSASIGVPFPRYEYVFRAHDPSQPSSELFSTNPLVISGGGGLGLEFP